MSQILIIYTGGTIGMMSDPLTKVLRPINFEQIMDNVPELEKLNCKIKVHSFEHIIDSSNMNPRRLERARRPHRSQLQRCGRLCHPAWLRYHGLLGLRHELPARRPGQARHFYRLPAAYQRRTHRRQGQPHDRHRNCQGQKERPRPRARSLHLLRLQAIPRQPRLQVQLLQVRGLPLAQLPYPGRVRRTPALQRERHTPA